MITKTSDVSLSLTSAMCPLQAAVRLDEAWAWLRRTRGNAPVHADIWHLRHHWSQVRSPLLERLLRGQYRLTPMLVTGKKKDALALWSAQDALVLKWVALCIEPQLHIPACCEHVKGHGGGPSSVARMSHALLTEGYSWVCRTDVKGYYGSMNKARLLACVYRQVTAPVLRGIIRQYVHYTVEDGGEFYTPAKGISRGCALSPLMGALYLAEMDEHFMAQPGIYYVRYMDDMVILAKTRWRLRKHVRALNEYFNAGQVEQHPDKTFIGKTERGFDWMGAQMGKNGVEGIAPRAKANYLERMQRLYERFRRCPQKRHLRMLAYRRRWLMWAVWLPLVIPTTTLAYPVVKSSDDLARILADQQNWSAGAGGRAVSTATVTLDLRNWGGTGPNYCGPAPYGVASYTTSQNTTRGVASTTLKTISNVGQNVTGTLLTTSPWHSPVKYENWMRTTDQSGQGDWARAANWDYDDAGGRQTTAPGSDTNHLVARTVYQPTDWSMNYYDCPLRPAPGTSYVLIPTFAGGAPAAWDAWSYGGKDRGALQRAAIAPPQTLDLYPVDVTITAAVSWGSDVRLPDIILEDAGPDPRESGGGGNTQYLARFWIAGGVTNVSWGPLPNCTFPTFDGGSKVLDLGNHNVPALDQPTGAIKTLPPFRITARCRKSYPEYEGLGGYTLQMYATNDPTPDGMGIDLGVYGLSLRVIPTSPMGAGNGPTPTLVDGHVGEPIRFRGGEVIPVSFNQFPQGSDEWQPLDFGLFTPVIWRDHDSPSRNKWGTGTVVVQLTVKVP